MHAKDTAYYTIDVEADSAAEAMQKAEDIRDQKGTCDTFPEAYDWGPCEIYEANEHDQDCICDLCAKERGEPTWAEVT